LRAVVRPVVRFAAEVERLRVPVLRPVVRPVLRAVVRLVVLRVPVERLAVVLRAAVVRPAVPVVLRAVVRLGVRAVVVLRADVDVVVRPVVVLRVDAGLRAVVFGVVVRPAVAFFAVVREAVVFAVPVFRAVPALRVVVVRRFVGLAGIQIPLRVAGGCLTALTVAGAFAPYASDPLARIGRNRAQMNPLDRGKRARGYFLRETAR
jgi:hypothetical protein